MIKTQADYSDNCDGSEVNAAVCEIAEQLADIFQRTEGFDREVFLKRCGVGFK